ncbi:unnamed protein product [Owenia fusiformis]|uniref:Uncharacterized protein n=1 Tax=Owenia fusiformis TaxID=6347 RepID=A0A8J1UAN6_OWEFU|nr:unnamed protein product [Owenia fusiformis]
MWTHVDVDATQHQHVHHVQAVHAPTTAPISQMWQLATIMVHAGLIECADVLTLLDSGWHRNVYREHQVLFNRVYYIWKLCWFILYKFHCLVINQLYSMIAFGVSSDKIGTVPTLQKHYI